MEGSGMIHPCRGCDDYIPENGCRSEGACGEFLRVRDLIMKLFDMRPSAAEKCIVILSNINALMEHEREYERMKCPDKEAQE